MAGDNGVVNMKPFLWELDSASALAEELAGDLEWHLKQDEFGNTSLEADSHVFVDNQPRKWRIREVAKERYVRFVLDHDEELPECTKEFRSVHAAKEEVEQTRRKTFLEGVFRVEIHSKYSEKNPFMASNHASVRASVDLTESVDQVDHLEKVITKGAGYVKRLEAKLANRDRTIRRLREELKAASQVEVKIAQKQYWTGPNAVQEYLAYIQEADKASYQPGKINIPTWADHVVPPSASLLLDRALEKMIKVRQHHFEGFVNPTLGEPHEPGKVNEESESRSGSQHDQTWVQRIAIERMRVAEQCPELVNHEAAKIIREAEFLTEMARKQFRLGDPAFSFEDCKWRLIRSAVLLTFALDAVTKLESEAPIQVKPTNPNSQVAGL